MLAERAQADKSLVHFKMFEDICAKKEAAYTAPLIRLVKVDFSLECVNDPSDAHTAAAELSEDWPWWNVPEEALVRNEMQADPRWRKWVAKTKA